MNWSAGCTQSDNLIKAVVDNTEDNKDDQRRQKIAEDLQAETFTGKEMMLFKKAGHIGKQIY